MADKRTDLVQTTDWRLLQHLLQSMQEQKEQLELKNQQLEGLFNHAPAGLALFEAHPPFRVLAHNTVYQHFFEEPFYSAGVTGKTMADYVPHLEESGILEVFDKVVSSGKATTLYNFPFEGLPTGRTWWNWHLSPVLKKGKLVALAHMAVEVTKAVESQRQLEEELADRKLAEAALQAREAELRRLNERLAEEVRVQRELHQLFSQVFNLGPLPKVITRFEDGLILAANDEYLRFYGYSRDEMLNRTTGELNMWFDPSERLAWLEDLKNCLRVRNQELHLVDRDGNRRVGLVSATRIKYEAEDAILSAFADITQRIQAEEEIRTLASEMIGAEQRERERISHLLHDDVQQLLTALKYDVYGLRDEVRPEVLPDVVAIEETIQKIASTTHTLSVELAVPIQSSNLKKLLSWQAMITQEHHQIQVDVQGAEPYEVQDGNARNLLLQIVRELLFNVVKHAGVDTAHIRVEEQGEELLICVEDQGVGFNVQEVLETPVEQLQLGLRDLQKRLGYFGGRLEVASQPGEGTRASIFLPGRWISRT